jgi:hypothetical protein
MHIGDNQQYDAIELHDAAADDDFVHHVVPVEAGWGATRQS